MYTEQKPTLFNVIAALTLLSGIVNLFWGFVASATALGTIVGVICLPITILPTILGAFEIIYAAKMLSAQPQPVQPSQSLAIFQITMFVYGNVFSAVVGILNLIFFNDVAVRQYFATLNGTPVVSPAPIAPPVVESAPVDAPVAPEAAEEPAKPKRIRKVAGQ